MSDPQIATLGITVSADGAIRDLDNLNQSLQRVSATSVAQTRGMSALGAMHAELVGHVGEHSLAVGRLELSIARWVGGMVGVGPVVEQLTTGLSKFALGSIETAGVMLAVGGIVWAYEKVTEGARKAKEENDKLVESLDKALHLQTLGPGGVQVDQRDAALRNADRLKTEIAGLQSQLGSGLDSGFGWRQRIENQISGLTIERQGQLNVAAGAQSNIDVATRKAIYDENAPARAAARKAEEAALRASEEYWRKQHELVIRGQNEVAKLYETARTYLRDNPSDKLVSDIIGKDINKYTHTVAGEFTGMPTVSLDDGVTKEQRKGLEEMGIYIGGRFDKTGEKLEAAISHAAETTAIILGNMLGGLIGGSTGSRVGAGILGGVGGAMGSYYGGMAGTAIGGAMGAAVGSVVPVVGTIVGSIVGSALGGLFSSHKNAVNANTAALNALTAQLFNSPQGYKAGGARLRADAGRQNYADIAAEAYNRKLRGGLGNMGMAA